MSLSSVATELATATGITQIQAESVLNILHFTQLDQHRLAVLQVTNDPNAVRALNLTAGDQTKLNARAALAITLGDLRLAMGTFQAAYANCVSAAMVA